jgi:trans-aconitate methyltransferase
MKKSAMDQWNPKDYHKNSSEQQKWGLELLNKIAFFGNERVLDIGCGDGKLTVEIANRVRHGSVLGIDKSENMIRFANEFFRPEAFPNLRFTLLDACDLNFSQEFDVVFSNAALHWISDHLSLLQRIKTSLKHGGKVIAQMGGKGNALGILKVLDAMMTGERWSDFFTGFSAPYTFYNDREYSMLLASVGLKVKRAELIHKQMIHSGREGLAGWIRTTWLPYIRRVPETLKAVFIYEIVDTYLTIKNLDSGGTIPVEMMRLEFEAERA